MNARGVRNSGTEPRQGVIMSSPQSQSVNRRDFISAAAATGAAAGAFALFARGASAAPAPPSPAAQPRRSSALAAAQSSVHVLQPVRSRVPATFDVLKQVDADGY
jgi:hypothetical protein